METRDGGLVDREARHFKALDIAVARRGRSRMVEGEDDGQVGGHAEERSLGPIFILTKLYMD